MVMCFLSVLGHVAFKITEAPLVHLENCRKSGNVKIIILVTWGTCEAHVMSEIANWSNFVLVITLVCCCSAML